MPKDSFTSASHSSLKTQDEKYLEKYQEYLDHKSMTESQTERELKHVTNS